MNAIKRFQEKLAEVNKIRDNYKSGLVKDPDNISYKLSLKTVEKHIAEIQDEIRKEKSLREKEVIELRLKGSLTKHGTIPLQILGDIAKSMSDAILAASQRLKIGEKAKGKISSEIINTLDLRLAGMGTGSTKIYITGNTAPDLFGNSLLEDTLENTFALLNSKTPQELTESVSNIGIRSVHKINKFLKTMTSSNLEVEMSWCSPLEKYHEWEGHKEKILSMSNSLDSIKTTEPEYTKFTGELIMASVKGQFEVKDKGGVTYKGTFPSQLLKYIKKLHIGEIFSGTIEEKTLINQATGYEKTYYHLVSVEYKSKMSNNALT